MLDEQYEVFRQQQYGQYGQQQQYGQQGSSSGVGGDGSGGGGGGGGSGSVSGGGGSGGGGGEQTTADLLSIRHQVGVLYHNNRHNYTPYTD
jgi:hypothetical protein